MEKRNIILAIDDVEPGLVKAVKKHSKKLGKELKGVALIDTNRPDTKKVTRDTTGFFEEIFCDFNNFKELQTVLKPYSERLLAATCRQESSIPAFGKAIPFLPYIYTPSESSLLWATEKHLMRDRMSNYDKNLVPKYRYFRKYDPKTVDVISKDMNFPVIVKPGGLAASILVKKCDTKDQLKKCLKHTFDVINDIYSRDSGRGEPSVLVEEMIEGDMYSTDAYVNSDGEMYFLPLIKVVTAHSLGLDGFYSHHFVVPVGLTQTEADAAYSVSKSAVRSLNLSSTTVHIELFNSPEGWKVIEIGPRIGGYREDLYRESYGIDHYYNDLAIRMGLEPEIPKTPVSHATSFNIYPDKEGRIVSIEGLEEAQSLESIISIKCHAKVNDEALFAGNGGRLIVDGTLSHKDSRKLHSDLTQLREIIKIKIEGKNNNL